jgi:drug/metabolite transporter (DMT)-like permease
MVVGLGAALLAAALFGVGAVVQAIAARRGPLISPLMGVVALSYVAGWALHLVAIAMVPLYVAQVGIAASLAVTALVSAKVVGEPLAPRHRVAICILVGGLALLAVAAGAVGEHRFTWGDVTVLYASLALILVLTVFALRVAGQRGGFLLGALGGLAYAGSPIGTRALVDPAWDLKTVAPVLSIGLFGILGFWLYSIAMRRASVVAASAPLVLLQTVLPAAVGVLAFGDAFRHGWEPVAVAGFLASTVAALALSDSEARVATGDPDGSPVTDHQPR